MTFQGTPDQQWAELMDRREKAGHNRQLVTEQDGRTHYQPPAQTMQDTERLEEYETFCRYCGEDDLLCICDPTGSTGYSDDALGWGQ